ncbi:hypothetical protein RRF57_002405 [Xylaria bambusicola]|uniref:Uncharacterized protein n=1 Tax=Xylaria bambusicola TaxID=326684 RepID=A0AAN7YVK7_9PEZI
MPGKPQDVTYSVSVCGLVDGQGEALNLIGILIAYNLSRVVGGYLPETQCQYPPRAAIILLGLKALQRHGV